MLVRLIDAAKENDMVVTGKMSDVQAAAMWADARVNTTNSRTIIR